MLFPLARLLDQFLVSWLVPHVRRPHDYRPPDTAPPATPDAIPWPEAIVPQLTDKTLFHGQDETWSFQAPSPVPSPWPESRVLHGRVMGPADANSALVLLHGAYDEYPTAQMLGQTFTKHGYRVLIPAAPCHMERTPRGTHNGSALFWSTQAFVLALAQWLAEVRGLIAGLRAQGVKRVGILGYSLGSQAAGLAATLWPDLDFVVLVAPIGHHYESIVQSRVAGRMWPWMRRLPPEEIALLNCWAPHARRPVVDRLLFLICLYDALQPTSLQQAWWQAWHRPPHKEYRHGHISLYFSPLLYRDLGQYAMNQKAEDP